MLRAARARLHALRAGSFAWLGARITERVSRGFAPPPALCAHLRAWLRAVSHASRGFARFARERFVRLHAPRAGFVRAPAHARLRAGFARALCARGFARFACMGFARAPAHVQLRAASRASRASRGFARAASRGLVASPGRIILRPDAVMRICGVTSVCDASFHSNWY